MTLTGGARTGFDPAGPGSEHWRTWLTTSLTRHGVPPDARLEMALRPVGQVPVARLSLDAWWSTTEGDRHARAEALIPARRLLGTGWPGWPAYQAGIRLVRALS